MESNRKIIHLIILTSLLFLSIIVYLTYFQIFQSAAIVKNPYNRRQWLREENTVRGTIYDRNGTVLAETLEGETTRSYPYHQLYSHLVGYSHKQYGRSGIEAYYNDELLGLTNDQLVSKIIDRFHNEKIKGNHLYLTINHQLQVKAHGLMEGKRGAVVAMDPKTGEILAMVSKPDFNPNQLVETWEALINDERSPLLNRGISGLYPPGSTFKPIMAAAVLENPEIQREHDCTGSFVVDGYTLSDYDPSGHGYLDLRGSLVVSCNTSFAKMALELGDQRVMEIARRFLMDSNLEADFPLQRNRFPYQSLQPTELAAVSIGQGKLLVTPLHMAAVASTFANDGMMPQPRIVKEIKGADGKQLREREVQLNQVLEPEIAQGVKEMMVAVVNEGTGKNAAISGVRVAGKTGTAQNESGENHAWFIGFAPAENPQIAVAVLLEQEGSSGGAAAAPIARELMREALRRGVLD